MGIYLFVGGATGIGRASIDRLVSSGHEVVALVRDVGRLSGVAGVEAREFDPVKLEPPAGLPERLEGLVYCPGSIRLKPVARMTVGDFEEDLRINLLGAVPVVQAALGALKRGEGGGSIVMFSSVAATTGMPFHSSVAASKAAVEGYVRAVAAECAPQVRANVISPSLHDTPLAAAFLGTEDKREAAGARHPAGRVGSAGEVASLVEWLLDGERSGFVTGQVIGVDGGMGTLRKF
jgi:3-oxoacyl-[acyl-carrier protein] reductase